MQRKRLAVAGLVSLLVVLAGCSGGMTTTESGPVDVEKSDKKPSGLFYFNADVNGQSYLCIAFMDTEGGGQTAHSVGGMSCDPIEGGEN